MVSTIIFLLQFRTGPTGLRTSLGFLGTGHKKIKEPKKKKKKEKVQTAIFIGVNSF